MRDAGHRDELVLYHGAPVATMVATATTKSREELQAVAAAAFDMCEPCVLEERAGLKHVGGANYWSIDL
eukprot:SAG31_NODE_1330_length_8749_cov_23.618844_3_plen_69_part_00